MTDEEYFRKHYPDYCYGDSLLSPCWDLFQDGVEFGERQSEKKIEELKAKNEKTFNDWLEACDKYGKVNLKLTKAIELLKWALHSDPEHDDLVDFDTKWKEAEQFLKEME